MEKKQVNTYSQQACVYYEGNDIILLLSEGLPSFKMHLNKEQALELSIILKKYSEELKK